ncbi:MAG TPA: GAF domain-containing protein, partial [Candidatus Baltobacteraceae bacterium]|nr:GAF domain-containing protein [Candidatus Baltobacteraceae bacterium]
MPNTAPAPSSELILDSIRDLSPDGILIVDRDHRIVSCNRRYVDMFTMPPAVIASGNERDALELMAAHVVDGDAFLARVEAIYDRCDRSSRDDDIVLADGRILESYSAAMYDDAQEYLGRVWFFHDTTTRSRGEQELRRTNRALRTLSACNTAVVRAASETELIDRMSRVITEAGGYPLVWIGLLEESGALRTAAVAGTTAEYVAELEYPPIGLVSGYASADAAVRTGQPQIERDPQAVFPARWRQPVNDCGITSSMTFPLKSDSKPIGAVTICSTECDAFGADEARLLAELSEDLSYGVGALRVREHNTGTLDRLERSLDAVIQTLGRVVEFRDPYTSGHQERVAKLAVSMAMEMGLSDDEVRQIRMAALVHDVGKIYIPAEILTKPGDLSPLEFEMLKTHPQTGSDILAFVDFP